MTMRMCNRWLLTGCVLVIALVSLGCGFRNRGGYGAETYTADDGTVINRMNSKEIGIVKQAQRTPGKYKGNTMCYIDAQRCQDKSGGVTWNLLLTVRWTDTGVLEDYQDTSTKESLNLNIDGETVTLWPKGNVSREKDQISGYITDTSSYPTSADVLRDLAGAREVNVSISGAGGTLEGYLDVQNIAAFKKFWEEFGDSAGQSATPAQ